MNYSPLDKPESVAAVFVEAWARRDADKLASLVEDARKNGFRIMPVCGRNTASIRTGRT